MLIIIEGVDGSGKTTLARKFESSGFEYVHNGPPAPGENVFETYTEQVLAAKGKNVVFDRLHLGELVYGTVVRKDPKLTIEHIRLLSRLIYSLGATTILCATDTETMKRSWSERKGAEYVQEEGQLEAIAQAYEDLLPEFYGLAHLRYNRREWAPGSLPAVLNTDKCPEGVIGSPHANFLVVGERAGGERDLAFYSDQRSSHFLNRCLWEAGFHEHELAFTNAYDAKGQARDLSKIHGELCEEIPSGGRINWVKPPHVIALGNLAQRQCEVQNLEYFKAPHPQYVKRFRSRQRWRYVELLRTFREEVTGK